MSKLALLGVWMVLGLNAGIAQLWEPLGGGTDRSVRDIYADTVEGKLYLVGNFEKAGGLLCDGIASWDGLTFHNLGLGLRDTAMNYSWAGSLYAISILTFEGDVLASGFFPSMEGDTSIKHLGRFNGQHWESFGTPFEHFVGLKKANGRLFALGYCTAPQFLPIAFWDGNDWASFGDSLVGDGWNIGSVAFYKGEYVFGGNFGAGNGMEEIARWNGSQWLPLGNGVPGVGWVSDMVVYKGQLFVVGEFLTSSGNADDYVMAWDGQQWYDPFPDIQFVNQVSHLEVIDDLLYIPGSHYVFAPNSVEGPFGLAKYDGEQFCSFGGDSLIAYDVAGLNGEIYITSFYTSKGQNDHGYLGDTLNWLAHWLGGDSTDICISQPVAIQDPISVAPQVQLFPNPTTTNFTLTIPPYITAQVTVRDPQGRTLVPAHHYPPNQQVDVSNLPSGLYLVEVSWKDHREVLKLIKQ